MSDLYSEPAIESDGPRSFDEAMATVCQLRRELAAANERAEAAEAACATWLNAAIHHDEDVMDGHRTHHCNFCGNDDRHHKAGCIVIQPHPGTARLERLRKAEDDNARLRAVLRSAMDDLLDVPAGDSVARTTKAIQRIDAALAGEHKS